PARPLSRRRSYIMTATKTKSKARSATIYNVAGFTTLRLVADRKTSRYHVESLPSDFGTAFSLTELDRDDAESYDLLLDAVASSCTCKGHTCHGHCKHVEALDALRKAGAL